MILSAVAWVVSRFLFSLGCDPSDPTFGKFVSNVDANMKDFVGVMEVFPWLRRIYPFSRKFQRLNARVRENSNILMGLITLHRKSYEPTHVRDYTDAFFAVQNENIKAFGNEGTFTGKKLAGHLQAKMILYCPAVFGHFNPASVKTDRAVPIQ